MDSSCAKIARQTADFCPSVWGDYFLHFSPSTPDPIVISQAEELVEEVKAMLKEEMGHDQNQGKALLLVDAIERLGLLYHFEEEIDESLRFIRGAMQDEDDGDAHDVRLVAIRFRLLRQHGYSVSSDVFGRFKDEEGKFKQDLGCDAKAMLALYEASWLGTCEELILDEAKEFARGHLERFAMHECLSDELATGVRRALETPFHRGMRRLEAKHCIGSCEEGVRSHIHVLLMLAKLDFSILQSLHQAEIKTITRWWRNTAIAEKLNFARDRVVECYFWSLGVEFEPQYSQGRLLLVKMIALSSVMDDMFDAYGTLEELRLFNDVIQRWELEDVKQLPEYMVVYLEPFRSVMREVEDELIKKGGFHLRHYLIESIKALVGAYFEEAKWANKGYMPTLEEYLTISVTSSGYPMLTCFSLLVMGQEAVTKDILEWVLTLPPVIKASALIARLMDDLVSTKLEQERTHVSSSVQCYMKDYGVSEEEACLKLNMMVECAWKDLNKECIEAPPSRKLLNEIALNFSRMIQVIYKHEDGYTNPSGEMKENIASLLVRSVEY